MAFKNLKEGGGKRENDESNRREESYQGQTKMIQCEDIWETSAERKDGRKTEGRRV